MLAFRVVCPLCSIRFAGSYHWGITPSDCRIMWSTRYNPLHARGIYRGRFTVQTKGHSKNHLPDPLVPSTIVPNPWVPPSVFQFLTFQPLKKVTLPPAWTPPLVEGFSSDLETRETSPYTMGSPQPAVATPAPSSLPPPPHSGWRPSPRAPDRCPGAPCAR